MYKQDYEKSVHEEREAKKENVKLMFKNDELVETNQFLEKKYQTIIQRFGIT